MGGGRRRPMGVWGEAPSRWKHGGLGAEPPALENFAFFCKNNNFRAILMKNNAFKTWNRNWQRNIIQLVALMGYAMWEVANDNVVVLLFTCW